MSWVKRNLYFLVSAIVAVVLLGLAGFYLYSRWALNNENLDKLNKAYAELTQIANQNPNPGNEQINNAETAKQQRAQLYAIIQKERNYFAPVAPIPTPNNGVVTKDEFASALRRTIHDLEDLASKSSVTLVQPKYSFSFQAQRDQFNFPPASLPLLATQLGDIKAICETLFKAKVNALEAIRRERVPEVDANGQELDYIDVQSVTNDLAVLTPYQVTFYCFTPELAGVLAGFANESHGFVVKTLDVEPSLPPGSDQGMQGGPGMPMNPLYRFNRPAYPGGYPFPGGAATQPPAAAPATRGGLPVVLDEKQLRVTLMIDVVKLLPPR